MSDTEPDLLGETLPIVCACVACATRAKLPEVIAADFRITSFYARRCTDRPWTVMVALAGRLSAVGHGETEEVALYKALVDLGVLS